MRAPLLLVLLILLVLLLSAGCGGDPAPAGDGGHQTVKLKLASGDCTDATLQLLASVRAAAQGQPSQCLQVQAQSIASLQQALSSRIRFEGLAAGPLSVEVAGHANGTCKSPPLFCARASSSLPVVGNELDLLLYCWGGGHASDYAACSGGAASGTTELDVSDGGCADDGARRVRSVRVKLGSQAAGGCTAVSAQDFSTLASSLQSRLQLSGLQPGPMQVLLWGFDDGACRADKLVACGQVDLLLPEAGALPLRCGASPLAGCASAP